MRHLTKSVQLRDAHVGHVNKYAPIPLSFHNQNNMHGGNQYRGNRKINKNSSKALSKLSNINQRLDVAINADL